MPFEKGKSGNPGGRPKLVGEVQALPVNTPKRRLRPFGTSCGTRRRLTLRADLQLIRFWIVAMAGRHRQSIQAASIDHQTK